jgi:hypothetical protein
VGGLAHLLRNRFYIGEVVYHGETFRGDHAPILDPGLFAAVQAMLASQAVERRCRIRGLPALLTGRLFDEQGHRMTPTHTNKKGVRYSYYVSHAALRNQSAGALGRVAAPELEALVVDAVRRHVQASSTASNPIIETDRELIERHLLRATLSTTAITLHLRQDIADAEPCGLPAASSLAGEPTKVTIPWMVPAAAPLCVLRPKARSHRDLVTVAGHAAIISAGEWITATGEWVTTAHTDSNSRRGSCAPRRPPSIDGARVRQSKARVGRRRHDTLSTRRASVHRTLDGQPRPAKA